MDILERLIHSLTSETSVTGMDLMWQLIIKVVCNVVVYLNEADDSSQLHLPPDFVVMYENMLVMKGVAKANDKDLTMAMSELVDKLHPS